MTKLVMSQDQFYGVYPWRKKDSELLVNNRNTENPNKSNNSRKRGYLPIASDPNDFAQGKRQKVTIIQEQISRVIYRGNEIEGSEYSLEPESSSASEFDPSEYLKCTPSAKRREESNQQKKKKRQKTSKSSGRYDLKERRVEQRKEKSRNAAQKRRNLESSILALMQVNLAHLSRGRLSPFYQMDSSKKDLLRNILRTDLNEDADVQEINTCLNTMTAANHLEKSAVIKLTGQALFIYRHLENNLKIPTEMPSVRVNGRLHRFPSIENNTFMLLLVDMNTMTVIYATPSLANIIDWPWINLIGANLSDILPFRSNYKENLSNLSSLKRITNIESNTKFNFHPNITNTADSQSSYNMTQQIDRYWCSNLYRQSSSKKSTSIIQKMNPSIQPKPIYDNNFYNKNVMLECWHESSFQTKFLRPMKLFLFRSQSYTLSSSQIKVRLLEKELEDARQSIPTPSYKIDPSNQSTLARSHKQENLGNESIQNALNYINEEDYSSPGLIFILDENLNISFVRNGLDERYNFCEGGQFLDHINMNDLEDVVRHLNKVKSGEMVTTRFPMARLNVGSLTQWFSGTINILHNDRKSAGTSMNIIIVIKRIMTSFGNLERIQVEQKSEPVSKAIRIMPKFSPIKKVQTLTNETVDISVKGKDNDLIRAHRRPRKQSITEIKAEKESAFSRAEEIFRSNSQTLQMFGESTDTMDSLLTSDSDLIDSLILSNVNEDFCQIQDSGLNNLDFEMSNVSDDMDFFSSTKDLINECSSDHIWLQPIA